MHFTSTDPSASLPPDLSLAGGVGTFVATIPVNPAAVRQLAIVTPGSVTAGTGLVATVTAKDLFGNTVAAYTGTVQFSSSDEQADFDFGTDTSPVASGYTRVTPASSFNTAQGYGWQSGTINSSDHDNGNDLTRDFNYTTDGTFAVNLANGTYNVTVTMGNALFAHDQMGLYLEGTQVDTVSTVAGSFYTHTYSVTVGDGQLNVRIADLGGSDPNAVINVINGLSIVST